MTSLEHMSDFALSLRRESNIEGSSVCSPLSIGLVLALLHAGANGATKTQIAHALAKGANDEDVQKMMSMSIQLSASAGTTKLAGIPFKPNQGPPSIEISVANRLYLRADVSIEQDYLTVIKANYEALAQVIDFGNSREAAATINDFVKTTTKGKISEIISADSIDGNTSAVLVNAIYFNAKWKCEFKASETRGADFTAGDGATRTVDMMHQTASFMYTETNEVQVLSMKYVDESYAYDVFLPKENFAGGLDAFLAGLTGTKMQTLLQKMRSERIEVFIPRAKIETSLNLKATLEKLGIKDVFGSAADLSGISSKEEAKPLYVSQIVHKAFIEMKETGTTAAAATFSKFKAKCKAPPKPRVFKANRPYLFSLSKDGAPMFFGVYC